MAVSSVTGNETFSATLTCAVQGIPRPMVAWSATNLSTSLSNSITNSTLKYLIEEFDTVSLDGLIHVQSILTVMNLSVEDELIYRCGGNNNVTDLLAVTSSTEATLTVQGI